jgi:hypothetical protein
LKLEWLKTFMNTPEEWHSFSIGFCEVLCPWPARIWFANPSASYLQDEYHYYMFGRALGFIALGALIILAVKVLA